MVWASSPRGLLRTLYLLRKMDIKYCWRCEIEVPFLNEEEYEEILKQYRDCMLSVKDYRDKNKLQQPPINDLFAPVRETYEKITGCKNMHHNAIMHHRLSDLGADCPSCGKPLRTLRAKLCPECGWEKSV